MGVKLPAPEVRVEPVTPIQAERPPTEEEITYSKLVTVNPLLEKLVECLDLVSIKTGERIRKVAYKPHPEKPQQTDKPRLKALAEQVLQEGDNYSKDEVVERISKATNVSQERAERGFNLMLQTGAIELTPGDRYYLTGSLPF